VPDGMPLDHLLKRGCTIRTADADVFSDAILAPHLIAVAGIICGRASLVGQSPLHMNLISASYGLAPSPSASE
jgi:hypothetical protein